jgi:lipoate-protein ligase A
LKKYSDYLRLKEFLQSLTKTAKSIYPCRFEWQQAHFEVKISGNAQSLADELVKKGGYLLLDIKQDDKNTMEINCMQKEEK